MSHLAVITPFLPLVLHPISSPEQTQLSKSHVLPFPSSHIPASQPALLWSPPSRPCAPSILSDNLRMSEIITNTELADQISYLYGKPPSLSSHPGSEAGLTRDRILWDSSCNSSKTALGMNKFSLLQNRRNLVKSSLTKKIITSSTDPSIFLVPALQNTSSKESKEEQFKFLEPYFSSQHCC